MKIGKDIIIFTRAPHFRPIRKRRDSSVFFQKFQSVICRGAVLPKAVAFILHNEEG